MRAGRMVGTVKPAEATRQLLAEMMVGREVLLQVDKVEANPKDVVVQVEDLRVLDDRRHMAVDGVSFEVRNGEILGIAGVQGNGQTELAEALTGLRHPAEGQVTILGHDTTHATPRQVVEVGSSHVPEDRQKHGLVLSFPVRDNLVLCTYYQKPFSNGDRDQFAGDRETGRRAGRDVRYPHAQHGDQCWRRFRAATSRR